MKSQGKPGKVSELCTIHIQVMRKSGTTEYLVHALLSSSLRIVVYKMVVLFVVSKCKLYHFA